MNWTVRSSSFPHSIFLDVVYYTLTTENSIIIINQVIQQAEVHPKIMKQKEKNR